MNSDNERHHALQTTAIHLTRVLIVAGFLLCARNVWAQGTPSPALTIAPLGTNTFSLIVANGISGGNYEILWTPVLNDTVDYPWTWIAVGTPGQTNFIVNMGVYDVGFFTGNLDTNAIPLWEAADPNNQGAGILNVWIDSPTNGATLN
jgi:hypothetical protein